MKLSYIIRLDDACPCMNDKNWNKVENLMDKYEIKPIVGIIPDSLDPDFYWPKLENFWTETAKRWVDKGWIIAQHGCHHLFMPHIKSEFAGLSYEEQNLLIRKGYDIMCSHGIKPNCFFSPAYTFDNTTIDVCRDTGYYSFLSDGYALFPHTYKGMSFLPVLTTRIGSFRSIFKSLDSFCTSKASSSPSHSKESLVSIRLIFVIRLLISSYNLTSL